MRANIHHGKIIEPKSLQWALNRYKQVTFEINKIEGQLADTSRLAKYKSKGEYAAWCNAAKHALKLFRTENNQLSVWIEAINANGDVLFRRAYDLLKVLELDCDFEPHESELMRLLDMHFVVNTNDVAERKIG